MSAILEAYWHLAAKRFVDNACMLLDAKIMGNLCQKMQEHCYVFVHDENKLSEFFEEDSDVVARRANLTSKRDRLIKANAAMANIQVQRVMTQGPTPVRLSLRLGASGVGMQLADEEGKIV